MIRIIQVLCLTILITLAQSDPQNTSDVNLRVLYSCSTSSYCRSLYGEAYRVCINCYQYLDYDCYLTTQYEYCGYRQMCSDGYDTPDSCQKADYYYNDTIWHLSGGAVAGIAVTCSLIVVVIIALMIYRKFRLRNQIEAMQLQAAQQNLQTQQPPMTGYQPAPGFQQPPPVYNPQQSHISVGVPIQKNRKK